MESLDIYIKQILSYFNLSPENSLLIIRIILPFLMLAIGFTFKLTIDFFLKSTIFRMIHHSETSWNDKLISKGFFKRITRFIPFLILYHASDYLFDYSKSLTRLIENIALTYIAWNTLKIISLVLKVFEEITLQLDILKGKPIKSYTQVVKIICYLIFFIVIISVYLQKSPLGILSGIGALTAIILFVFKDSILGFVASVQIASYDMIRVGDWIEMDQFNADGDVIDISLNNIKVQNWDKTISSIPTYSLVAGTFKNWRGMQESGGRRIKRSLYIDISSVHFCERSLIDKLSKIEVLNSYILLKETEIKVFNEKHKDDSSVVNLRQLTNLGSFRIYIREYLKHHPLIRQDMTLLVRQLQPEEKGIPIEVYCFTNTVDWTPYEEIQSDIFDHLVAVIPEFELRIYQKPAGNDIRRIFNELK